VGIIVNAVNHANVEKLQRRKEKVAKKYVLIALVITANVVILAIADKLKKKKRVAKNYVLIVLVVIVASVIHLAIVEKHRKDAENQAALVKRAAFVVILANVNNKSK